MCGRPVCDNFSGRKNGSVAPSSSSSKFAWRALGFVGEAWIMYQLRRRRIHYGTSDMKIYDFAARGMFREVPLRWG